MSVEGQWREGALTIILLVTVVAALLFKRAYTNHRSASYRSAPSILARLCCSTGRDGVLINVEDGGHLPFCRQ